MVEGLGAGWFWARRTKKPWSTGHVVCERKTRQWRCRPPIALMQQQREPHLQQQRERQQQQQRRQQQPTREEREQLELETAELKGQLLKHQRALSEAEMGKQRRT